VCRQVHRRGDRRTASNISDRDTGTAVGMVWSGLPSANAMPRWWWRGASKPASASTIALPTSRRWASGKPRGAVQRAECVARRAVPSGSGRAWILLGCLVPTVGRPVLSAQCIVSAKYISNAHRVRSWTWRHCAPSSPFPSARSPAGRRGAVPLAARREPPVAMLERELACRCSSGVPGGTALSEAGRALLPYAEAAWPRWRTRGRRRGGAVGGPGGVTVALVGTLASTSLTSVLRRFARRHPRVELVLRTATSREVATSSGGRSKLRPADAPDPSPTCTARPCSWSGWSSWPRRTRLAPARELALASSARNGGSRSPRRRTVRGRADHIRGCWSGPVSTSPDPPHRQPDARSRLVEAGFGMCSCRRARARGLDAGLAGHPGRSRPGRGGTGPRGGSGGVATWGRRAARCSTNCAPRPAGWRFPAEHPPSPEPRASAAGPRGRGPVSSVPGARRLPSASPGSSRSSARSGRRCSSPSARSPHHGALAALHPADRRFRHIARGDLAGPIMTPPPRRLPDHSVSTGPGQSTVQTPRCRAVPRAPPRRRSAERLRRRVVAMLGNGWNARSTPRSAPSRARRPPCRPGRRA